MNQPHYLTVGQAAALSGVSVRTLRYYDQIGLLKPSRVAESGYRYYGGAEVNRLQDILYYRAPVLHTGKFADAAANFIFQGAGVSAQGNCVHPPPAGF